jgi:hypothetical protein
VFFQVIKFVSAELSGFVVRKFNKKQLERQTVKRVFLDQK